MLESKLLEKFLKERSFVEIIFMCIVLWGILVLVATGIPFGYLFIPLNILIFVMYCFDFKNLVLNKSRGDGDMKNREKKFVAFTTIMAPIFSTVIYYWGWKHELPYKAGQAAKLSWLIFLNLVITIAVLLFVLSNISLKGNGA